MPDVNFLTSSVLLKAWKSSNGGCPGELASFQCPPSILIVVRVIYSPRLMIIWLGLFSWEAFTKNGGAKIYKLVNRKIKIKNSETGPNRMTSCKKKGKNKGTTEVKGKSYNKNNRHDPNKHLHQQ